MKIAVIGAGPAGLAMAACAGRAGHRAVVLERADQVASSWHRHYDRLHLHTPKSRSALPFLPMPDDYPRYPSRRQVIDYFDAYAARFVPDIRFGTEVRTVAPEGNGWRVVHDTGDEHSDAVVFATGLAQRPHQPGWPGLDTFPGPVLHSSAYKRPDSIAGARVLVVGFGNSGGEIAIDLAEAGREVDIVVRGAVNLLPKELLGIPIVSFGLLQKLLPYRLADAITAPILRLAIGDYARYGLVKSAKGPVAQVREDGRIPLIDIGTLRMIRANRIGVQPGIERIDGARVVFGDGLEQNYDAILLATGFEVDLRPMLAGVEGVLDPMGRPLLSGGRTAHAGLYFCSYRVSPNGQIRAIADEAPAIVADLSR